MLWRTMCHGRTPNEWSWEDEEETEEAGEHPSLSETEPAEDVEILTDGGDDWRPPRPGGRGVLLDSP